MTVRLRAPFDALARLYIAEQPHSIVAWYLMASYLYEHTDQVLLTDGYYDELCRDLIARWDQVQHPHKHLVDRSMLEASSAMYLKLEDYPRITMSAAQRLMDYGAPAHPSMVFEPELEEAPPAPLPAISEPPRLSVAASPPPASAAPQGDLFG